MMPRVIRSCGIIFSDSIADEVGGNGGVTHTASQAGLFWTRATQHLPADTRALTYESHSIPLLETWDCGDVFVVPFKIVIIKKKIFVSMVRAGTNLKAMKRLATRLF